MATEDDVLIIKMMREKVEELNVLACKLSGTVELKYGTTGHETIGVKARKEYLTLYAEENTRIQL